MLLDAKNGVYSTQDHWTQQYAIHFALRPIITLQEDISFSEGNGELATPYVLP